MSERKYPRPRVVMWFQLYCTLVALLAIVGFLCGLLIMDFGEDLDEDLPDGAHVWLGGAFSGGCFFLFLLYATALFLPARRWAWVYGLVVVSFSTFWSACLLLFTVPLTIFWVAPPTRAYYGWVPEDYHPLRQRPMDDTDED